MKAYRITSTEYQANEPSVFLFVEGAYYGCLIYPSVRKYPQDIDYWRTATCADSDRYFHVEEVEVSEGETGSLKEMQACITHNTSLLKPYTGYRPFATKEEREADYQQDLKTEEANRPIEREILRIQREERDLILGLKAV